MYTKTNPVTGTIVTTKPARVFYVVLGTDGFPFETYGSIYDLEDKWETVGPEEYPTDGEDGIEYYDTVIKEYNSYISVEVRYWLVVNPFKH